MRRLLLRLLLALTIATSATASVLDWLLPRHEVQIIAVTDTTPVGALRRPASQAAPIYYSAVSAGYRDLGGIIAGDKIPKKEVIHSTIAKVLAKQGYLPADDAHPASLLLLWTWGTLNTDTLPSMNPDLPDQQVNRQQLLRFMGAYKVGLISKQPGGFQTDMFPGTLFQDADQQLLTDLSTEDLYIIAIAAYDYTAMTRKEKVLLWTTKISCPSRGLAMDQTLPTMLALAAPYIGRETVKPMSVKATEQFKPDVRIGDPKVVEYLEKTPIPVAEAPAPIKKPTPPGAKKSGTAN